MKLNIRPVRRVGNTWQDLGEEPALINTNPKGPPACKKPLQSHLHGAQRAAEIVIGCDGFFAAEQETELKMVLQVFTNPR